MRDVEALVAASAVLAALVVQWRRVTAQIAAIPLARFPNECDAARRYDDRVLPLTPRIVAVAGEVDLGEEPAIAA